MSGGGEPLVGRSLWQDAVRRLRKNKLAVFGSIYVLALLLACLVLPTILDWEAQNTHVDARLQPPSFSTNEITGRVHLCGTDELGRDLLARCFLGGQISFAVGIIATLVAVVIGTIYGAISGYFGGRTDYIMMRIVDVLYGIPFMFIVIIILVVVGRGIVPIFVSLGIFMWLTTARIVRGQVMSYKNREFVLAARIVGASRLRIIFRHLLPNAIGPVIVYSTLSVPAVILLEAFLAYLGLGVQEPNTSWGLLAADGSRAINPIKSYWWLILFPSLFLATSLLALNFIGDGLRDALDPKGKR